jgi:hypothetical protein
MKDGIAALAGIRSAAGRNAPGRLHGYHAGVPGVDQKIQHFSFGGSKGAPGH